MVDDPYWLEIAKVAIPGLLAGSGAIWLGRWRRKDEHEKEEGAKDDRRRAEDSDVFSRLVAENLRYLQRQQELEKQKESLERDNERGFGLARFWHQYTHELRHWYANKLMVANFRLMKAGLEPIENSEILIPDFDAPEPLRFGEKRSVLKP